MRAQVELRVRDHRQNRHDRAAERLERVLLVEEQVAADDDEACLELAEHRVRERGASPHHEEARPVDEESGGAAEREGAARTHVKGVGGEAGRVEQRDEEDREGRRDREDAPHERELRPLLLLGDSRPEHLVRRGDRHPAHGGDGPGDVERHVVYDRDAMRMRCSRRCGTIFGFWVTRRDLTMRNRLGFRDRPSIHFILRVPRTLQL